MRKGFTLLELLIVVVIIGILSLIAAPTMLNSVDRARDAVVRANVLAAASSITSRFALQTDKSAEQVATEVVAALFENTNPINEANPAFATEGETPGTVVLDAYNAEDLIRIRGYNKDGVEIITKVVSAPADD